jgi:hypothetical protein
LGADVNDKAGADSSTAGVGSPPAGKKMSRLFALFQPQPETRPLFNTLVAFLGESRGIVRRVLLAALQNFWQPALLGAVPGLLLLVAVITLSTNPLLTLWGVLCALTMIVIGSALVLVFAFSRRALVAIPQNNYGLCKGYAPACADRPQALTNWLSALVNRLAGLPEYGNPLTFGDLWGGGNPDADQAINLAMITTNLSHGRPYRLPFDTNRFFFDPIEFAEYFPPEVVNWMVSHPRRPPTDNDPEWNGRKLMPLPKPANFPVVVATRMSLSFPILLSAVPLYAVNNTRRRIKGGKLIGQPAEVAPLEGKAAPRQADKCWFSDGGIASNFPIHFFDAPLPRRPTFGINLRSFPPGVGPEPCEANNIWMPKSNQDGSQPNWTYFESRAAYGKLLAFLNVIIDTARTWSDEAQMTVPGYRDRIVHINFDRMEGGLNLTMDPQVINRLSDRGQAAGALLAERFANPDTTATLSWDNHRWTRYRSTMALLEATLHTIGDRLALVQPGERTYKELIQRKKGVAPKAYYWKRNEQQKFADEAADDLIALAKKWRQNDQEFAEGAPNPRPELRIQPRI